MSDNLQALVDEMRAELSKRMGGYWRLQHDKLAQPLYFEVVVDGTTSWLVFAECGDQRLMWGQAVEPQAFLADLYVLLRRLLRQLTDPALAPS
jgi:hypothetical protein